MVDKKRKREAESVEQVLDNVRRLAREMHDGLWPEPAKEEADWLDLAADLIERARD